MLKNKLWITLSVIVLLLGISTTSQAFEFNTKQNTMTFTYPVTTKDPGWKELLTREQMVCACSIPENVLSQMPTGDLLITVLDYPLITDFFAYNSLETAVKQMLDFNGFSELMNRPDSITELLKCYSETAVANDPAKETNYKDFLKPTVLEFLIHSYFFVNGYNDTTLENYRSVHESILTERHQSGLYSGALEIDVLFHDYSNDSKEVWTPVVDVIQNASIECMPQNTLPIENSVPDELRGAGDTWTPVTGVVQTPLGNAVPYVYSRSPELTQAEKAALNNSADSTYPLAQREYTASIKYNCHSFAWYNATPYNPYWINQFPSVYIIDGSYSTYSGTPYSGIRAAYVNDHSAIYTGSSYAGTYYVESKWGYYGVYLHLDSYGPYGSPGSRYKRN